MLKLLAFAILWVLPSAALADSFWDHNGSLMRLSAQGSSRVFSYEVPRDVLVRAGAYRGTVLFEGVRDGNRYYGTARVFSRHCEAPLEYEVEGVVPNERTVVLSGTREVYEAGCRATGQFTIDRLVFNFEYSE